MTVDVLDEYARLSEAKDKIEAEIAAIAEELTGGANPPGLTGPLVDSEGFPRADIDVYRVRHQRHAFACLQTDHKAVMKQIEQMLPQVFAARTAAAKEPKTEPQPPRAPPAAPAVAMAPAARAASSVRKEIGCHRLLAASSDRLKKPFALVQSVQNGAVLLLLLRCFDALNRACLTMRCCCVQSPAATALLRAGDQVLVFGTADATNHRELEAVKEIVLRNVGSAIRVIVRRRPAIQKERVQGDSNDWEVEELVLTPQRWQGAGVLGCVLLPFQEDMATEAARP
ncbi:TPA: LOW QUALITY PROTEIN: hypothetical protein N0F65_003691 [Lagenidium giganteum]|uniref:Nas2 N-terminal domain-containing protein n=1 Tax=Lagenidium giganteum TaxID=4803 RepID=A0AAV2YQQ5_9STRA|nr:TPA: LOW QUALITY PROTEIN: hypothetical protein N0F65_003691 [Lagenidium giganteum]